MVRYSAVLLLLFNAGCASVTPAPTVSLKNKVDHLMKQFRGYYEGKANPNMTELRRSYDLLMMKVIVEKRK